MELIYIPSGEFFLGDNRLPDSAPQERLDLPAYQVGRYPVTNAQFSEFIAAGGYAHAGWWTEMGWKWHDSRDSERPAFWGEPPFSGADQPVVGVTWYEAVAFCRWLGEREGKAYRLPSEAEWEKAARGAGDAREFPWGDGYAPGHANTAELGLGRTTPVDAFPGGASPFGVWDLAGNVFEWTASKWGKNWQELTFPYPYRDESERNDPGGSWARVMRGGSWYNSYAEARCARRSRYLPGSRGSNIGFRVARSVEKTDEKE